ncbi:MAG: multidrug effflux MFS transporter [Hyphomicrobiales bacterium]|nr:multidrug effflux MFS transporter [Hyphomicrobiales bacterium]
MLKPDTLALTVLLGVLTALGPLSTDMYLPSLPAIAEVFGSDTARVQLTLSLFLTGFAVGQIVYGPISDRHGRKPVLIASLALYAVASLACAFAPTIEALIAARFVQAVGACGPIVLARSVVRDLYAGARAGQELSRMGSIMGVVPAIAPILGGFLQTGFGWQASFLVAALFGLAAAAAVRFRLPETLQTRLAEPLSFLAIFRAFGEIGKNAGYRAYVAIVCASYAGLFAFISGSSFVLQDVYGLSEIAFGVSFSLAVIGYITGTLTGTRLAPRIGLDRTLGFGVAALATGGTAMLAGVAFGGGHAAEIVVPMMLYMVGVGLSLPQSMAGALMPFPDRAGTASSLMGCSQMLVAATVGVAVGHSLGASAWPLAIAIAAMGLAAASIFLASRAARARSN